MPAIDAELSRFKHAQDTCYHRVVRELLEGKKQSHWMWFVFPQIVGLGNSAMANQFAIQSLAEGLSYLDDTLLSSRLIECCQLILSHKDKRIQQIFPYPDDLKLQSSMTLFSMLDPDEAIFKDVLTRFYQAKLDSITEEKVKVWNRFP